MSTDSPAGQESPASDRSIDKRTRRAATEYMTVLESRERPGFYQVITESGGTYLVDPLEGRCDCPDSTHREPEGGCKHARRVWFATGEQAIPAAIDREDVDPHLGEHVEGEVYFAAIGPAADSDIEEGEA